MVTVPIRRKMQKESLIVCVDGTSRCKKECHQWAYSIVSSRQRSVVLQYMQICDD